MDPEMELIIQFLEKTKEQFALIDSNMQMFLRLYEELDKRVTVLEEVRPNVR